MQWMLDDVICVSLKMVISTCFSMTGVFSPVLCQARGGVWCERIPGGRSAHLSGRRLAHLRSHPAGVTPEALAAAGPVLPQPQTRFPTRRHASDPKTRLPAGDTPPSRRDASRTRHLRPCCHWCPSRCPGQDPSSVLVATTTKTDEGSRLRAVLSGGRARDGAGARAGAVR